MSVCQVSCRRHKWAQGNSTLIFLVKTLRFKIVKWDVTVTDCVYVIFWKFPSLQRVCNGTINKGTWSSWHSPWRGGTLPRWRWWGRGSGACPRRATRWCLLSGPSRRSPGPWTWSRTFSRSRRPGRRSTPGAARSWKSCSWRCEQWTRRTCWPTAVRRSNGVETRWRTSGPHCWCWWGQLLMRLGMPGRSGQVKRSADGTLFVLTRSRNR